MLTALRRARYGDLLARHSLLWCAAGRHPTEIAAVLFCSRSSVYRTVRACQAGTWGLEHADRGRLTPPLRTTVLLPALRRSLVALRKAPPRAYGWCRTRWSCATLALTLEATRGLIVSAATMRRWVHAVGWVWKRANLVATDDDPHRVERLARSRWVDEPWPLCEVLVCADARALHWLPQGGYAWMPPGSQVEVMTPGMHATHDLAGALALSTGTLRHCSGPRTTTELCQERLQLLDTASPSPQCQRVSVGVDNDTIHQAQAVAPWWVPHPRLTRRLLPPDWPRANPIARAFGAVHDLCTRNHPRQRWRELVADVAAHLHVHGPWNDPRSALYYAPAVTTAVAKITAAEHAKVAA